MILNPLFEKLQTVVLAVVFLAAGFYTFGNALKFDRLYIGILLFACWLCRKDWNVLAVIAIIAIERVVEEAAWLSLSNVLAVKLPLYCLCFFLVYKFSDGLVRSLCLVSLGLVVLSESYWLLVGYAPPEIYWDAYYLCQSLIIRWLFVRRCFLMSDLLARHYPGVVRSLDLDYILSHVMMGYVLLSLLQLVEFQLRHTFGLQHIDFVHGAYPFVAHSFSIFILFSIFSHSIKVKQINSIHA